MVRTVAPLWCAKSSIRYGVCTVSASVRCHGGF